MKKPRWQTNAEGVARQAEVTADYNFHCSPGYRSAAFLELDRCAGTIRALIRRVRKLERKYTGNNSE